MDMFEQVGGYALILYKNNIQQDSRIIDEIIDLYHKHEFKIDDYML